MQSKLPTAPPPLELAAPPVSLAWVEDRHRHGSSVPCDPPDRALDCLGRCIGETRTRPDGQPCHRRRH